LYFEDKIIFSRSYLAHNRWQHSFLITYTV